MRMDKIFITGGDGMLGNSIVRVLLQRNYAVKCLVKKSPHNVTLDGLDVEIIVGDLMDSASWKNQINDCSIIINAAAYTKLYPRSNKMCYEINTFAVETLIALGKEYKITKFIQVGTANSFEEGSLNSPGNESNKFSGTKYKMDYINSKYKAQEMLLNEFQSSKFPVVIINPTFMIGPFDSMPSSGKMIIAITNKKVPGYSNGGKSFAYSKDVAVAVANSIKLGRIGECYIAGGENLSYQEFFKKVCKVNNVNAKFYKIPNAIVLIYGFISSLTGRITAKTPTLSYGMARLSLLNQFYSSQKAITELKMPQTNIEVAIKECTEWLKDNNKL